jgi:thymidylate kinase
MVVSGRIDVVQQLSSHQQHLHPRPAVTEQALLALPLPMLCRIEDPSGFQDLRARILAELSSELGGGDGPLRVIDFEASTQDLPSLLDELARSGIRKLYLHGVWDQPELARSVAIRWPGSLFEIRDDAGGRHSVLTGLLGESPGRTPKQSPGGGVAAEQADIQYATDPARQMGTWSGILPPEGLCGDERGAALRKQWEASWRERGVEDVVSPAVLGLDARAEAALQREGQSPERSTDLPITNKVATVLAITGIDGSGKSTHVAELCRRLSQRSLSCQAVKIYRQGAFLELSGELGARTRRGGPVAGFRLSRVIKLLDSLATLRDIIAPGMASQDVLVMDRYLETHIAAAESQLGWDLRSHPVLAAFPEATTTFWLQLDIASALARLNDRGGTLSADEHELGLRGYLDSFAAQAAAADQRPLDAHAPFEENADLIETAALAFSSKRSIPSEAGHQPSSGAAAANSASARRTIEVDVGARSGEWLGRDVANLRRFLAARGQCPDQVPEAFWLEGMMAQQLIDLRTSEEAKVEVAVWPSALARIPLVRDLPMVAELGKLLEQETRVASWSRGGVDAALLALGASASGARRIGSAYDRELALLAAEEGWPVESAASSDAPSAPAS